MKCDDIHIFCLLHCFEYYHDSMPIVTEIASQQLSSSCFINTCISLITCDEIGKSQVLYLSTFNKVYCIFTDERVSSFPDILTATSTATALMPS
jgi:hypothetical protein